MPEESKVRLYHNALLREIVEKLPIKGLDWLEITERFKGTKTWKKQNYEGSFLASRLGEIALQQTLEDFASSYDGRMQCNPIPHNASIANYKFFQRDGELKVHKRYENRDITGIDALMLIDNLPVVFEMKLGKNMSGSRGSGSVKEAVKEEKISDKVLPLQEYFEREECGYVLIVFPELIHLPRFSRFKKRGGIVIPFWMKSEEYRQKVSWVAHSYNLWHHALQHDPYFNPVINTLNFYGEWSNRTRTKEPQCNRYSAPALSHAVLPEKFVLAEK